MRAKSQYVFRVSYKDGREPFEGITLEVDTHSLSERLWKQHENIQGVTIKQTNKPVRFPITDWGTI